MTAHIEVKLLGKAEVEHALDQWQGEVKAPRRLLIDLVGDVIAPDIAARFAASGPGWQPLSPAYADWKKLHFPGKPLLVRSGKMREALTDRWRFGGAQSQVSQNSVNLLPKDAAIAARFAAHQQGGHHLPARPMVDLRALDTRMHTYLDRWLTGRAKDFGLVKASER